MAGNTTTRYKQYISDFQKWQKQAIAADPAYAAWLANENARTADMGPSGVAWNGADYSFDTWLKKQSPAVQSDYATAYKDVQKQNKSSLTGRIGSAMKIIPAAVGGIGLAGAAGLLGSGAGFPGSSILSGAASTGSGTGLLGGVDAAMADLASAGGLTGESLGAVGSASAGGIGTLGSVEPLSFSGALPEIGASGLSPIGAGTITSSMGGAIPALAGGGAVPALAGGGGSMASGLLSGLGKLTDLPVKDLLSLGTGAAGLANALRKPDAPDTPDYMALAKLQADLDQQAADKAVLANRPNQVDAAGNTRSWIRDPITGQWTQKDTLSAANQNLLNTSQDAQLQALQGVANRGDFNFQGPSLMDPVGNSADIQQAWMNLLNPQRKLAREGEIQRLKNQGLTEDSPAFQRAMLRLDEGDTDAQNKALIAGTAEYGNQFGRSLASRQQSFGEYQTDYNAPMQQYQGLMGIAAPSGQFGAFTNAPVSPAANVYGAGQDQYAANTVNANVKNATNNNLTQGLFGLAGNIARGGWGG